MHSGPEPFDSPDVQALCLAQQAEMLELYEGEADIGPTREASMFVEPHGVFLVIREDGRAIGCGGIARFDETRGELKRMYVVPEARGRGAMRALWSAAVAALLAAGHAHCDTDWRSTNVEADRCWRALGFRPTRYRLHRYVAR